MGCQHVCCRGLLRYSELAIDAKGHVQRARLGIERGISIGYQRISHFGGGRMLALLELMVQWQRFQVAQYSGDLNLGSIGEDQMLSLRNSIQRPMFAFQDRGTG